MRDRGDSGRDVGWKNHYTMHFRLRRWGNQVLNFLYPESRAYCLLCHRPMSLTESKHEEAAALQRVCLFCLQDAMDLHPVLRLRRVVTRGPTQAMTVVAAHPHQGLVRTAIRQWKYDGQIEWTDLFADWMYSAWRDYVRHGDTVGGTERGRPQDSQGEAFPDRDRASMTVIVPVPASADRFRKRGYNHVHLLADSLSGRLNLPVRPWLKKVSSGEGFTQSQTARDARARREALKGTVRPVRPGVAEGARILLVDDIVTTGATLSLCAEVLYREGAREVVSIVIADVE